MVVTKDEAEVIADALAFSSGQTEGVDVPGWHTPAVCVSVDDLGGLTDDTITVRAVGDASSYVVDERTASSAESYIVEAPQANRVTVTSANGATISAEARNNPR